MLPAKTIPFELPEPGVKVAVNVIDQTGMEHMMMIEDLKKNLREGLTATRMKIRYLAVARYRDG